MSARKPLLWVCSSKKDLKQMPTDVQDVFGYALDLAQSGLKHPDAKPLKGFGGAGVLELIEDFDTQHLPGHLYGSFRQCHLCIALLSEEVDDRNQNGSVRH